jgi:cell division septation protein DedD
MLFLFFGLVMLCALFFGMGFSMGKNSVKSAPEPLPTPATSSTRRPSAEPMKPPDPTRGAEAKPSNGQPDAANQATSASSPAPPDASAMPPPLPGTGYFVQVAAVSKREDADALVESLNSRQYKAFIADNALDKLLHVQVGPFADIKDAEATRSKLVSDGYNPILKK